MMLCAISSMSMAAVPEDGLKLVIDQARRSAKIAREVAAADVADLTFLREAQKELGIKGR